MMELKIKIYKLIYRVLNKVYKLKQKFYRVINAYNGEKSKNRFAIIKHSLDCSWSHSIPKLNMPDDSESDRIYNYANGIDRDKWGYTWYNHSGIWGNINTVEGLKYRVPTENEFVPGFEYFVFNALEKSWEKQKITKKQLDNESTINGELVSDFIMYTIRFKLRRNEILTLKDEFKK